MELQRERQRAQLMGEKMAPMMETQTEQQRAWLKETKMAG